MNDENALVPIKMFFLMKRKWRLTGLQFLLVKIAQGKVQLEKFYMIT